MTAKEALLIEPRQRDIGNLSVNRLLPFRHRRAVGPFVFFDHMGPVAFGPGTGLDVLPHPHIGLATLTYLIDGEISHRDSLGTEQMIRPGDVNWMTAGRGIVHSERTPPAVRAAGGTLNGLQIWIGLPAAEEERAPAFEHHGAADLPELDVGGAQMRLVAGRAFGARSPVAVFSDMFFIDADCPAGTAFDLPTDLGEGALNVLEGQVSVADRTIAPGNMLVLEDGAATRIAAHQPARLVLLGGAPLDGDRHMWWNFVSSSRERIERAKADWAEGRFDPVPGETEFVPLPGT